MWDWIKSFAAGKTTVVVVNTCCHCKPRRKGPAAPTLSPGDSIMAIKYPITMPADTAPDVVKRTFKYKVNGGDEQKIDFDTANATGEFIVPVGAAVDYFATETDGSGNESEPGTMGHIDSAADTTPPMAPGAPVLGPGETVPD